MTQYSGDGLRGMREGGGQIVVVLHEGTEGRDLGTEKLGNDINCI